MLPGMSAYPLSADDRAIQDRARAFVDEELIPWASTVPPPVGRATDGIVSGE